MTIADLTGTIGVSLILLGYLLTVFGRFTQHSAAYLWLNLVGSALAGVSSVMLKSVPFTVLEGAWVLASAVALLRKKPTA